MRYEKFYIGNTEYHPGLFNQLRGKEAAPNRVPAGIYNMINETSSNNGVTKKADSNYIFEAPAITVSVNFAQTVFLQEDDFCASVNILILKSDWLEEYKEAGLYIVSMLKKANQHYDYSFKISKDKLNETVILLPTLTNPDNTPVIDPAHKYHPEGYIPDWEYMQDYIKELEQDYIRELEQHNVKELEQYLMVTGLNDYKLTDEDREVLGDKETKEFALENIFHKIETEKIIGKANDFPTERSEIFNLPLLTAGINNQGLARYAKRDDCPTIIKNAISVSANGANSGASFYQPDDFSVLQDSYALKVNGYEIKNQEIGLYLTTALNKAIADNHDWNNKAGWNKIKKDKISLPIQLTSDNSPVIDPTHQYHPDGYIPDWEYMGKYIKAIEKLVIKDVVKYKDEMIGKMKEIIKEGKNTNITQLKYKDVILLKAKNIIEEIAGYTNPNDGKYINCFRHISFSIEDLMCLNDYVNEMGFNTTINKINELYESVKTIILNMCEKCFEETENTKYFKFVRDIVNHPDGISSKKYLDDNIYKEYINTNENKIILKDISYDVKNRGYLMFPSTSKRIFNKKYKDEFGLIIDLVNPRFIMLVCPYDKLFDCILDLMSQLKINYISLDDTTLEWGDDEDKMEPKNDQQFY